MRVQKLDSICKECKNANMYNCHKCTFAATKGDCFSYAKTGRIGLAKDGKSCKYFSKRNLEYFTLSEKEV